MTRVGGIGDVVDEIESPLDEAVSEEDIIADPLLQTFCSSNPFVTAGEALLQLLLVELKLEEKGSGLDVPS